MYFQVLHALLPQTTCCVHSSFWPSTILSFSPPSVSGLGVVLGTGQTIENRRLSTTMRCSRAGRSRLWETQSLQLLITNYKNQSYPVLHVHFIKKPAPHTCAFSLQGDAPVRLRIEPTWRKYSLAGFPRDSVDAQHIELMK